MSNDMSTRTSTTVPLHPTLKAHEELKMNAIKSDVSTDNRVHGFKLAILLGSLTLVTFLSLLE